MVIFDEVMTTLSRKKIDSHWRSARLIVGVDSGMLDKDRMKFMVEDLSLLLKSVKAVKL